MARRPSGFFRLHVLRCREVKRPVGKTGGEPSKTMLYRTGPHHLHPAPYKMEHYGPGWAPVPARSV